MAFTDNWAGTYAPGLESPARQSTGSGKGRWIISAGSTELGFSISFSL